MEYNAALIHRRERELYVNDLKGEVCDSWIAAVRKR